MASAVRAGVRPARAHGRHADAASAFLTVVRRGSATAAAEELFVTQPSVSAAIAALEREGITSSYAMAKALNERGVATARSRR